MSWPAEPFWDYSIALYSAPGVEAACLELERRHGLDVNLLLFACWLASRRRALDRLTLARAVKAVKAWQNEVVRPLRAIRRRLKVKLDREKPDGIHTLWPEATDRLRAGVLALELDSEHLAQLVLGRIGAGLPASARVEDDGPALALANIRACWPFDADDEREIRLLLAAACPDAADDELTRLLASSWD